MFFRDEDSFFTPQPAKFFENLDVYKAATLPELKLVNPNLHQISENLLKGIQPTDIELQQLNDVEKAFLLCLKEKKGLDGGKKEEEEEGGKIGKMNSKRNEEQQKLFFKKAFGFIDELYFRNKIKNRKRIQKRHKNYEEFYEELFGETSRSMGVPIENFYHPQKKIAKLTKKTPCSKKEKGTNISPGLKSFNKTYIYLIMRSQKFRKLLDFYLENEFRKECEESRRAKISKCLQHCNKIIDDLYLIHSITTPDALKQKIIETISSYLLCDSKAKLPWSDCEISEAYASTRKLMINN